MFEFSAQSEPAALAAIRDKTIDLGFDACSGERTGQMLAWLAGSLPGGLFLDLGSGTGMSAAWLLTGMDSASRLVSVDIDEKVQSVARTLLADDPRVEFVLKDCGVFLETSERQSFDMIFADAWPGKFSHRDAAIDLLRENGLYVIDDLFPQPNWPLSHQPNVDRLVAELEADPRLTCLRLDWSTGIMLARRKAD
jgi:predicted O-methyltransferase YrrM